MIRIVNVTRSTNEINGKKSLILIIKRQPKASNRENTNKYIQYQSKKRYYKQRLYGKICLI